MSTNEEISVNGVYTAMITPLLENQDVNIDGLRSNIEFQIESGISGILVLGTTGETPTLTEREQREIIIVSMDQIEGRVPLMVGTGKYSTRETIENTNRAAELGADIALIVTPYYNKPTQRGLVEHFRAITQNTDIPIMVYNIQGRTGVNIETATLEEIAEMRNIIGVKEASGNIHQMGDVINTLGRKGFSVMSGDDALTYPLMALGGKGVISVVSNAFPEMMVEMMQACNDDAYAEARRMHFHLLPLFKAAFVETNPQPIKYMMNQLGLPAGPCRLPLTELTAASKEKINNTLGQYRMQHASYQATG